MYGKSWDTKDYATFSKLRFHCKQLSRSCYQNFIHKSLISLVIYTKFFWQFVKNCKKSKDFPVRTYLST